MGKLVRNDGNILLGNEETEIIVVICINKDYMCVMNDHYVWHIFKLQQFINKYCYSD